MSGHWSRDFGDPDDWRRPHSYPQDTNGYAVASLVLGIIWLWWIGSILALAFGYAARKQIAVSGGRQGGDGLAIAGIVLGWVGVGTFVYFWFLIGSLAQIVP
jgi:hypothetical protein